MKKLSAILLIVIFAFSQYARHLNYLECRILNTFKQVAMKCDCEKLVDIKKTSTDRSSAPKAHLHLHLDEFFAKPSIVLFSSLYPSISNTSFIYSCHEPDGIYPAPWQPPNS